MPKQKKQPTIQELFPIVSNLSTQSQIELKDFIWKILEDKKQKAIEEQNLIEGRK